jgi:hypothetical protein
MKERPPDLESMVVCVIGGFVLLILAILAETFL